MADWVVEVSKVALLVAQDAPHIDVTAFERVIAQSGECPRCHARGVVDLDRLGAKEDDPYPAWAMRQFRCPACGWELRSPG